MQVKTFPDCLKRTFTKYISYDNFESDVKSVNLNFLSKYEPS